MTEGNDLRSEHCLQAIELFQEQGVSGINLPDFLNLLRRKDMSFGAVNYGPEDEDELVAIGFVFCPVVSKTAFISGVAVHKNHRGGELELALLKTLITLVKEKHRHISSVNIVIDINQDDNWESMFRAVEELRKEEKNSKLLLMRLALIGLICSRTLNRPSRMGDFCF